MTRRIVPVLALSAGLALAGCAQLSTGVETVCTDMARLPPEATAVLDAQNSHSALGVLWADAKSACVAGVPAPGVGVTWGAMIWGELKVLIPQLLPALVPLVMGLL